MARDRQNSLPSEEDEIAKLFVADEEDEQQFGDNDDLDFEETTKDVVEEEETDKQVEEDFSQDQEAGELGGYFDQDDKGNLVDKKGNLVARAGKERKTFEQMRTAYGRERAQNIKLTKTLANLARDTKALWDKYKEVRDKASYGKTHGLSDQEELQAVQLMAQAKLDPKAAIHKLLTMAQMRGIDLTDLGVSGSRLDPGAVAQELHKLQTAEADKNKKTQTPDVNPQQAEINEFLTWNPDALGQTKTGVPYVRYIAAAKARFPDMTLEDIWTRIKQAAAKRPTTKPVAGSRQTTVRRPKTKGISTEAVHPSTRWDDLAKDVLADIRKAEQS